MTPEASHEPPSGPDHESVPVLELKRIRAAYGRIEVLHGIDLVVAPGTVFALIGPNGAGKTTALRVCAGLLAPRAGSIRLAGRRVNGVAPERLARAGVCLIPEGRGVFPNLTVHENLRMMSYSGPSVREIEEVTFGRFPRLKGRRRQVAGTLSGGEQQMLSLARGLATDPGLLLLDELSMGLAPLVVEELYGIVAQIAAGGVSVLIVEQFTGAVLAVADRAAIMRDGYIVRQGAPRDVEDHLSADYLGA